MATDRLFYRATFLGFYLGLDRNNVLLSSPTPMVSVYRAFHRFRRSSWEAAQRRQTAIRKNNIFRVRLITTLEAACTQARGDDGKTSFQPVEKLSPLSGVNEVASCENCFSSKHPNRRPKIHAVPT